MILRARLPDRLQGPVMLPASVAAVKAHILSTGKSCSRGLAAVACVPSVLTCQCTSEQAPGVFGDVCNQDMADAAS